MAEIYRFEPGKKRLTPREVRRAQTESPSGQTPPERASVVDLDVERFAQYPDEIITFEGLEESGKISKLAKFVTRVRWYLAEGNKVLDDKLYNNHRSQFRYMYTDSLLVCAGSAPGSPRLESMEYMSQEEKKAWVDELEYRLNCWKKYKNSARKKPKK